MNSKLVLCLALVALSASADASSFRRLMPRSKTYEQREPIQQDQQFQWATKGQAVASAAPLHQVQSEQLPATSFQRYEPPAPVKGQIASQQQLAAPVQLEAAAPVKGQFVYQQRQQSAAVQHEAAPVVEQPAQFQRTFEPVKGAYPVQSQQQQQQPLQAPVYEPVKGQLASQQQQQLAAPVQVEAAPVKGQVLYQQRQQAPVQHEAAPIEQPAQFQRFESVKSAYPIASQQQLQVAAPLQVAATFEPAPVKSPMGLYQRQQ